MKIMLMSLLLCLPMFGWAHPIHVSVCEMKQNTVEGRMEITIKIFADDFNEELEARSGKKVNLGLEGEHKNTNQYIMDYLKEHLVIVINGKQKALDWVGKEVEDIATWCHLTVPASEKIQTLQITNSVMMQKFSDQVNVVHVDCNDKMNSTFFSRGKETDTFKFK